MADTHPGDGNLERYWKHGKGAAIIGWGSPGSWTRCHVEIGKHVGPEKAARICSQWYHDVTGHWVGEQKGANPLGRG
jgi:hypothetical protein